MKSETKKNGRWKCAWCEMWNNSITMACSRCCKSKNSFPQITQIKAKIVKKQ